MGAKHRVNRSASKKKSQASVLPAIIKTIGPAFLVGTVLKLINVLLIFVSPQILRLIIQFIETATRSPTVETNVGEVNEVPKLVEREPLWHGVFFAVALFGVASLKTLLKTHHYNCMSNVGQRIRTALIAAIYRKALILSNSSRKESTVGEIVNLMAVDAQRFKDLAIDINMMWSAPLQVVLALYFLWELLGPSALTGKSQLKTHYN